MRISFLGDLMCEGPFLHAANKAGRYEFDRCFEGLRDFLLQADFVVGNVETPLTDSYDNLTKTDEMYSFNTPKEYAEALKNAGLNLALTANNHCLDRGEAGLLKTIDVLDSCGLSHTGTYKEDESRVFIHRIKNVDFAIISCTASTNYGITEEKPTVEHINLINEETATKKRRTLKQFIIYEMIGLRRYMAIRKLIGKSPLNPSVDNFFVREKVDPLLDRLKCQIEDAKTKADFVFVCPHMGGQFNRTPGAYSEYIMQEIAKTQATAIIASHAHILQKMEFQEGKPCFYSIGNVTMSMDTEYLLKENHPDLGVIVNVEIENGKKPQYTCTITKEIEEKDGYITVFPLADLINNSAGETKERYVREYYTAVAMLNLKNTQAEIMLEIPLEEIA